MLAERGKEGEFPFQRRGNFHRGGTSEAAYSCSKWKRGNQEALKKWELQNVKFYRLQRKMWIFPSHCRLPGKQGLYVGGRWQQLKKTCATAIGVREGKGPRSEYLMGKGGGLRPGSGKTNHEAPRREGGAHPFLLGIQTICSQKIREWTRLHNHPRKMVTSINQGRQRRMSQGKN